jgi:hypothetical protein
MQDAQERIRAGGHTGFVRQRGATFATGLQRKCGQQLCCVIGPSGVVRRGTFEAFGEDLASATRHIAEPTSTVDTHPHRLATPGQIERAADVAAVLTLAQLTARGHSTAERVGLTTRTRRPSRSTTIRTMHQRSDSAPSDATIATLLDGHASAISPRPEDA